MLEKAKNFARSVLHIVRNTPYLLYCSIKLKDDPNFKLENLDRGLLPRPQDKASSVEYRTEVARRIIAAYKKGSADLILRNPLYQVSNEWVPIFRKPLLPLLDALESGDANALRDLLDNFFRKSISAGLCGLAADMEKVFFTKRPNIYQRLRLLVDGLYRYRLVQNLLPETTIDDLQIPDVGNPYGIFVDGKFMRTGVDYQYYYAQQVSTALNAFTGRKTVMELGGGIGGFAYFLNKARQDLTYVNLDLPEILCISAYQLINMFPERKVLLYGETESISSKAIASYDIVLLPSFLIEDLDENSINISFNSYSLAEISPDSIVNYVNQISRVSKDMILHVNHVSNAVMGADSFDFNPEKFSLVSRKRALWNLGRNRNCDEYEFFLKCKKK